MSKKALVTFTPLDPYLFGGELTHGNGDGANYFSKGNPLPQQTTLSGTLRHLLLKRGYERGPDSFTPDDPKLNDYGDLLSLSPLFLTNGAEYFLRQPIDQHESSGVHQPFVLSAEQPNEWVLFDTGELRSETDPKPTWQNARCWEGFEAKKGLADGWVSSSGKVVISPDDIFKIFVRPGIPKKEVQRPHADGPGLFKQQLYRLEKNWAFCVLAEFSDEVDPTKLSNFTLPMGAEKSVFHICVKEDTRLFEEVLPPAKMFYTDTKPAEPRLVLTSDAWVPDDVWPHTLAAVTDTVDFRHIRTDAQVKAFGRLHRWKHGDKDPNDQMAKSAKYTLLQRGSVLVCKDADALAATAKALSIQPWTGIGFNHFFTYP